MNYIGSPDFIYYEKKINKKINDIKNSIDNDISLSIEEINKQLTNLESDVEEQLTSLNSDIEELKNDKVKLYSELGSNIDGAITQAAVTEIINNINTNFGDIGSILDEINRVEV